MTRPDLNSAATEMETLADARNSDRLRELYGPMTPEALRTVQDVLKHQAFKLRQATLAEK